MHGMCVIIQLSVFKNDGNRMRFLRRTRTAFDLVPIEEQDFFGLTTIIVFRVGYRTICVDQCIYLDYETLIRPSSKTLL